MVNFGLNSEYPGYLLAVAGGLYFLLSVRPELSRDHDIFCCHRFTLRLHSPVPGWRLDPILQFGQLLLSGSAIFLLLKVFCGCSHRASQAKHTNCGRRSTG